MEYSYSSLVWAPSQQLQPLSALFYHKYYSSLQFWSAVPTDFQMQIFPPLASWLTYAMLWDVFKLNIFLQITLKYKIQGTPLADTFYDFLSGFGNLSKTQYVWRMLITYSKNDSEIFRKQVISA